MLYAASYPVQHHTHHYSKAIVSTLSHTMHSSTIILTRSVVSFPLNEVLKHHLLSQHGMPLGSDVMHIAHSFSE